jgi:YfiR/HmsC-like
LSISIGLGRRSLLSVALAWSAALWLRPASAQSVEVPVRLQAELLAKVVGYDRSFSARAGPQVLVFVVIKPGSAESERTGEQISSELGVLPEIGGLPHSEETVQFVSARVLADLVKSRRPAIVVVSAALANHMEPIARALDGLSVLSVGISASYVPRGAVLGFDVESGKARLVVHLEQARRQHVAFRPELLSLARVIQ